jgi:8-oxo-dGTP diphosphatase
MAEEKRVQYYADVLLVLIKDEQVLLSKRVNTGYFDGYYSLVAGHLEYGETFKEGIIREAKEEAGITLIPEDLKIVHITHRFNGIDRVYFSTYMKAEKWQGEIINAEPDKCDDLKWFSLDNIPENIVPAIKFALDSIKEGKIIGEFGFSNSDK